MGFTSYNLKKPVQSFREPISSSNTAKDQEIIDKNRRSFVFPRRHSCKQMTGEQLVPDRPRRRQITSMTKTKKKERNMTDIAKWGNQGQLDILEFISVDADALAYKDTNQYQHLNQISSNTNLFVKIFKKGTLGINMNNMIVGDIIFDLNIISNSW